MAAGFVTHLECALTGARQRAGVVANLSAAGKPLLVRYDLAAIARAVRREDLQARQPTLWRFREFLPLRHDENIVSLGEPVTPLIPAPETARRSGATGELLIKDEGRLPTGSFKARGMAVAVSMANELGITAMAMPTAGNAGAALAAYATRARILSVVFVP